jgi:hypothetical protein
MLALSYTGEENSDGKFWTREGKMTNGNPEPSLEIHIKKPELFQEIKSRRLGWFGHLVSMEDRSMVK